MGQFKKIAITCCSNGQERATEPVLLELRKILERQKIQVVFTRYLYGKQGVFSGSGREKAEELNDFYRDPEIDGIFDVSGGDLANEVLEYLDYDLIGKAEKEFWGYSDLTTILNGIYAQTGKTSVLYQVRNFLREKGEMQQEAFFQEGQKDLFQIPYHFIRGEEMKGIVAGGNIRCLLKLAGTPYFPDMEGKLLLLEACGGRAPQMAAYLNQLKQMSVFDKIAGILLGTFTTMEKENSQPSMEELVLSCVDNDLPVAKTDRIGHGADSRAIRIGGEYRF